ncbi:MAG: hypothetical protein ACOX1G_04910 [bacterium]
MKRTYILLGLLLICSSIMPGPSEGSDVINILPTPKSLKQEAGKVSLASGEAVIVLGKRASDLCQGTAPTRLSSRVSATDRREHKNHQRRRSRRTRVEAGEPDPHWHR